MPANINGERRKELAPKSNKECGLWSQVAWVQILALSCTGCVTLGSYLTSLSLIFPTRKRQICSPYLTEPSYSLNVWMLVKHLGHKKSQHIIKMDQVLPVFHVSSLNSCSLSEKLILLMRNLGLEINLLVQGHNCSECESWNSNLKLSGFFTILQYGLLRGHHHRITGRKLGLKCWVSSSGVLSSMGQRS